MNIIGLDFGTTNSILSFYNEQTKNIEAWKMGGVDGNNYIPSFLSIEEGEILIGEAARNNLTRSNNETFSKFKILLNETNAKKLQNYNFKDKTPKEITKLYIEKLLNTYKEEKNIQQIDSLVLTVPEIWIQDDLSARTIIKEIADELKLPLKKLISEPVAAGAYFIDNYKNRHSSSYNGHLLIFDYGGGTLDITLLEASNEKIKTLERTGKGSDTQHIGKAGVAYDELVIVTTYQQTFQKELEKNSEEYYELILEFERKKIENKDLIKKYIVQYNKNKNLDREIFSIRGDNGKISIKSSSLVDSFEDLLATDIKDSLKEIEKYFNVYGINKNNHNEFRIVMVGGFSNYFLSQNAVRDFFDSKTDSDRRFETNLTLEDTAFAISKGATLIANEFVTLDETYPMSIGLVLFRINNSGIKEELKKIIFKKGNKVINNKVHYTNHNIISTGRIVLFLDNGRTSYKIKLDKNPEDIFPNYDLENNSWNIGFSMDENSFFYLYIKDKSGKERKTEIGNIIKDYRDSIIVENEK